MPDAIVAAIAARAREIATEMARAQWGVLTGATAGPVERRPLSIVDPEALVLLSLAFRPYDRRVAEMVAGAARTGARLLGVDRMAALAPSFSGASQEGFREFAWMAAEAGDGRWGPHAERPPDDRPGVRRRRVGPLRVVDAPALMVRLRAGLGVGGKADVLTFLLGVHGAGVPLKGIALATGYTTRELRKAVEEMGEAGLVRTLDRSPLEFCVDHRAWASVLGLNQARPGGRAGVPPWRWWSMVFAFLAAVDEWAVQAEEDKWSAYVASSRARDLVQDHAPHLHVAGIELPDPRQSTGAAYLEDFAGAVHRLGTWCRRRL